MEIPAVFFISPKKFEKKFLNLQIHPFTSVSIGQIRIRRHTK